ncbi:MAG: VacJ family lipoprotein [Rickettsiales bacterium]|nr:VacJ family lipoprotein [Rickettsiales bacterium]
MRNKFLCLAVVSVFLSRPALCDEIGEPERDSREYEYEYEYEYGEETAPINDPFEKMNRKTMNFNLYLLNNVVSPFMKGYRLIVPSPIRKMINNLGDRVSDIPIFISSALALDYDNSIRTLGVFGANMTIGIFGLFDPAKKFGLERAKMNFGDVFRRYGADDGFYLVLPFLGPSSLTDSIGSAGGFFLNPTSINSLEIGSHHSWTPNNLIIEKYFVEYVGDVETADRMNEDFIKKSFDSYVFIRDAFLRNRDYRTKKMKGGN